MFRQSGFAVRGLALVIVVLALALALPYGAAASEEHPRLADLESEIFCPTCETTLDQSDAPAANRIRAFIERRIAAGATESEIKDELVDQFGPSILAAPPKRGIGLLAWLLPLAGLAVGAVAVAIAARRWSRRAPTEAEPEPLEPDVERQLDEELAKLDG